MKKINLTLVLSIILLAIAGTSIYYFIIRENSMFKTCTTYSNSREKQCVEDYIGLTQDEAISRAKKYNYRPKIESIDGVDQFNTDDLGPIIFFVIEDGVVTDASFVDDPTAN